MKNITKIFRLITFVTLIFQLISCELNALDPLENDITDPNAYTLPRAIFMGTTVKISGTFIVRTDSSSLYLRSVSSATSTADIPVEIPFNGITGWTVSFKVPSSGEIPEGRYHLVVKRGNNEYIIKRKLAAMSVFANESFNREPIEGDNIIVSDCKIDKQGTDMYGAGDEIILKGIGFSPTDSLYFDTSRPAFSASPHLITDTEARFIVPSGLNEGIATLRFSNMPVYSIPTGYKPSFISLNGIKFGKPITGVSNIILPAGNAKAGEIITIKGTGFTSGDKVVIRANGVAEEVNINETALPDLSFSLPTLADGKKSQILLKRQGYSNLHLGFIAATSDQKNSYISNVSIPTNLPSGLQGKALTFTINGSGFITGDKIILGTTVLTTTSVTTSSITVSTPAANTPIGEYNVLLRRGTQPDELIGKVNVVTAPRLFEYAEGGIVFWLDSKNPVKGMVCAVKDATPSNNINDSELSKVIFGIHTNAQGIVLPATSLAKAIGTGAANTQSILEIQKEFAKAAIFCDTLVVESNSTTSYNDWYIPSIDELTEMFRVRASINTAALVAGRGGEAFNVQASTTQSAPGKLPIAGYMSSSAFTFSRIWAHSFQNANQKPTAYPKINYFRLRPVRSFDLSPN
ncbi:MAG: IPT/TIG domain-containing protein [Paludibacter sp.]|jgi:hypothetical protein|nr:IPT/TIG domain-containing protein [Paludibacter sp.]